MPFLTETWSRPDKESGGEIDWDNIGFGLTRTDYMYVMRCSTKDSGAGAFSCGELSHYGNVELSPSSGVLNYGQVRSAPLTHRTSKVHMHKGLE
jgi:branched-chain amino acid aminotransferase